MTRRHPAMLLHLALIGLLATSGLALASCGDGGGAAPAYDTLTPTPQKSGGKRPDAQASSAGPTAQASASTRPSATTSPSSTATPKPPSDAAIKRDILARIGSDPGLRGFAFIINVRDGIVTISGRVRTKKQKSLVEQICLTSPGVVKVLSAIEVSGASGY